MKNKGATFILGLIIFVGAILQVILFGGSPVVFVNFPSIIFVAGIAGGLGLAAYKGGGFIEYVLACKKYFIPAGVLGTVVCIVLILRALEDPSKIGMGIAVALLSAFYGLVFYCVADALLINTKTPDARV